MSSISCSTNEKTRLNAGSRLLATASFNHGLSSRLSSISKINLQDGIYRNVTSFLSSSSNFVANENLNIGLSEELNEPAIGNIRGRTTANLGVNSRALSRGDFKTGSTDKFSGYKPNFRAYEKLFPTQDILLKSKVTNNDITLNDQVNILTEDNLVILTENNNSVAVNGLSQIYSNIDEGVFIGDYVDNGKVGSVISDDANSVLFTYQIFNDGDVQYKFRVTKPLSVAKLSYLAIRASAPFDNYLNRKPQQYKFYDIKLEDPSGNLIIQYEDIPIRGDSNFTTYISKPQVNNLLSPTWYENYPLMDESGPYTLTLNLTFNCQLFPFDTKFGDGYEQTCIVNQNENIDLSPSSPNPFIGLNLSSIEIGNSGGVGILRDSYLNFYSQVRDKSERVTRTLLPTQLFTYDFNNGIYPQASSIWQSTTNEVNFTNTTLSGASHLVNKIRNDLPYEYITLSNSTPTQDSGRIILKFNTKPDREAYDNYIDGAFAFGGSKDFSDAKLVNYLDNDNFFDIDTLELKIIAKKPLSYLTNEYASFSSDFAGTSTFSRSSGGYTTYYTDSGPFAGAFIEWSPEDNFWILFDPLYNPLLIDYFNNDSINDIVYLLSENPNYVIDVVGYSDDKLLNVTPAIGGFLQNSDALNFDSNNVPNISGFYSRSLSISDGSLSDLSSYFEQDISSKGDHYSLTSSPVVNTTSFQEYTIPLSIYQDPNSLGYTNYSVSSFFENLYLDISPLPSGASICSVKLVINYKPANAIMMHTLGSPSGKDAIRKSISLLPSSNGTIDPDASIGEALTGFTSPLDLAANYSRRWRGNTGDMFIGGDFDRERFDFSFNHQQSDIPFLTTYVDFSKFSGQNIYSYYGSLIGNSVNSNLNVISSLGWRYIDSDDLSSFSSTGMSFDRAVLLDDDYLTTNLMSGPLDKNFVFFLRYTPNNLTSLELNNHVIASFYDAGNDTWGMIIVVEDSFIKVKIKAFSGEIITLSDNYSISEYVFPLSILVTYDSQNNKLRLYTNNQAGYLRDTNSVSFTPDSLDISSTLIGFSDSYTDQPSLRSIFVHELGYSNSYNIVESNPDRFLNQISVNDFFDSYKVLANNIDDNISAWKLGDFKICSFSSDFDSYTKREGKDYLTFNLNHHGSGYSQFTNKTLPSNIKLSGVSYHTQIENDFLRFDLSNIPTVDKDRFYAIAPRISKTLPRGYQFNEEAICVDTVIEHHTNNDMTWPNGKAGPKLIVSLYTTNQEIADRPSKMFGLINRSTHYLEPSGCIRKLTSKFTFDDLFDDSEPWATFDIESYTKEFKEKYFSKDIDDMFLQYDLVYPSGRPFSSLIKMHTANVRLDDAIYISEKSSGQLNLTTSGQQYQVANLNLFVPENGPIISSGLSLFASGNGPIGSGLNMFVDSSGFPFNSPYFNLHTISIGSVSNFNPLFGDMFGSSPTIGLGLSVSGQLMRETYMPLYVSPLIYQNSGQLSLNTFGPNVNDGQLFNDLTLQIRGIASSINVYPSSEMPFYVFGREFPTEINNNAPLFVISDDFSRIVDSGSLSLHTLNYPISTSLANSNSSITWDTNNVGRNITAEDNSYAYVDSDDNIRGVDLLCYGSCNSTYRCSEAVIDIHGIKWYEPEVCVDGGIFRAKSTYTNLSYPSGSFRHTVGSDNFSSLGTETSLIISAENDSTLSLEQPPNNVVYDPMPYSGHFYGIRKYTGLAPKLPYYINITGKSGSTTPIDIPTEIIEVEYNKNETDQIPIDYSGFRLVAGESYRSSGNEFGKSIASKDNLLAIGSPRRDIVYNSGVGSDITLEDAGTVFLYRRQDRPSGYSWPLDNYKSPWVLEEALTLPSELLKDYYVQSQIDLGLPLNLRPTLSTWFVGQEGRQFGHSLDISINKDQKSLGENSKQILVVGGPSAKWTPRIFDSNPPSGVNIGLIVFTDEFTPRIPAPLPNQPFRTIGYEEVLESIKDKDIIFNYFGNPRIQFNVKLIICQPIADSPDVVPPSYPEKPDFITLKSISRNYGYNEDLVKTSGILSGIKEAFFEAFPYDSSKLHNNIPPMLGMYVDNSSSLGRESLEPAIDQFINFYKDYSFSGGLIDFNNVRESGQVIEYVPEDYSAENWVEMSQLILSEVLSTGNLVANNQVRFLTGSVGTFNSDLAAFNVPPESGGKVYIFEKESGSWNLIQEIRSPNVTYSNPDRFGHAVSISDDSEVVVVGSPYISQAVMVFERKDEEKDRFYSLLYNWVKDNRPNKYVSEILLYENSNGFSTDQQTLYLSLDKNDKFKSRVDLGIQEYQNIYTFDYSNMQPNGSWSFIPDAVAPTSRLGYSVDVNEDGSVVVASSPTDSLNLYNDGDVYYVAGSRGGKTFRAGYIDPQGVLTGPIKPSWSSSVNAGSIHVFESRKYYPHNKVIEYGRFGNLHEDASDNTPDSGHFHYLANIFQDKNFTKTEFADNNIPQEAGLAFIITPYIDALSASDEVYNNIVEWLALGDRNLVLVGNDPVWEENGKYKNSNDIINKLLERLSSRMRIMPARNKYESLPGGYSSYSNIIPSFVPQGSTPTYVQRSSTRGSGVADIRIYSPGYNQVMPCAEVDDCTPESTKIQIQSRCEMPLVHYGDLRAQWNASCCTNGGLLVYGYNWPFIFGSYTPACGDVEFSERPLKNFEPIPLLAASEKISYDVTYPAVPAQYRNFPIFETVYESTPYNVFGSPQSENVEFVWDSGNVPSGLMLNASSSISQGRFYKPEEGLLQANGVSKIDLVPFFAKELVSDRGHYCVEYNYFNTTSKVIVLAGVETESTLALLSGQGDQNIKFYENLVSKTPIDRGGSDIAQLGSWTGRTTFKDGYSNSYLLTALRTRNYITQDVDTKFTSINRPFLNGSFNVAWVANIISQPSQEELISLKEWMSTGNKKLIITCGNNLESINQAKQLCNNFNLSVGPVFLPYLDQHPIVNGGLTINQAHQTGGQFNNNKIEYFTYATPFYPLFIAPNSGGVSVAYDNRQIYDEAPQTNIINYWDMNAGVAKATFPVLPCSGYKLFITTVSDSPSQIAPLFVDVENATYLPQLPCPIDYASSDIRELNGDGEIIVYKSISNSIPPLTCQGTSTQTVDIQAGSDVNSINVYFSCAVNRVLLGTEVIPKTTKLIGVSGVLIPVYQSFSVVGSQVPTNRFETVQISEEQPEFTETVEVIRPISTINSKYCSTECLSKGLGNQFIDDGPVVAAQEIEILSEFNAGVARSRITVITDSSIVQGKDVTDNGVIPSETLSFIRSLYPETNFPSTNYGRQFDVYTKIVSPERGSPSKYFAQGALSGLNTNFGNVGTVTLGNINQYESEYIPKYVTRPDLPWKDETDQEKINEIRNQFIISGFLSSQIQHASTARFSGIVDGIMYSDATVAGGLPQLLKDKGYDYLDLDKLPSGYRGDLFGYSVCVKGNKILVGSPFSAFGSETITPWNSGVQLRLGSNGGAGAVYMFEKSIDLDWTCSRKFRPSSLMGQLSGINSLSDNFGHSIDLQNDVIAIGSPSHKYGNHYESIFNSGAFARKNFDPQFDIPSYSVKDLGYLEAREELEVDGINGDDAGAIYVYENKITDWENKQQSWALVEKIISNPTPPERLGSNVYISRPYRSDADYTVFAGCQAASGGGLLNAGAAYTKDIMLKKQVPSFANSGAWIKASVFGERPFRDEYTVNLEFSNSGNNQIHYGSGIVISNNKGEIFIEVSGQDPSTKGFIAHRPYIESVLGRYQYGKILENGMVLFSEGRFLPPSSQMNLFIDVENSAYVYNTLGLYGSVMTDVISSGLNLFIEFPSGSITSSLNLFTASGTGSLQDNLNLQVRGK